MKINFKNIKHASASMLFTVFFVIFVILANIFVDYATTRFSLKVDMTPDSVYKLDESTKELVSEMNQEVTIYMLKEEAQMQLQSNYYILQTVYQMASASNGKIKYEFISPNKNPAFFEKYTNAKGNSKALVIVSTDKKYKVINSNEMIPSGHSEDETYINVESAIDTALVYVLSEKSTRAAFVNGHGELDNKGFNNLLSANGITQMDINLLTEEIPEDVSNLIIMAPSADFSETEIDKIDRFLAKDGTNVFIFWDFLVPKLPNLELYLEEWGVGVGSELILDQNQSYQSPRGIFAKYTDNDATQAMSENDDMRILSPDSRPLNMLWAEKGATRVVPLAHTSAESYGRLLAEKNTDIQSGRKSGEPEGPFYVAMMSEKNKQRPGGELEYDSSRIYTFGSYTVVNENVLQLLANQSFVTSLIAYGNDGIKTMQVTPKLVKDNDLNIYQSAMPIYRAILLIVLPLIILAVGIYIFLSRRYK